MRRRSASQREDCARCERRRFISCTFCSGRGTTRCDKCEGYLRLVHYNQLEVEWSTQVHEGAWPRTSKKPIMFLTIALDVIERGRDAECVASIHRYISTASGTLLVSLLHLHSVFFFFFFFTSSLSIHLRPPLMRSFFLALRRVAAPGRRTCIVAGGTFASGQSACSHIRFQITGGCHFPIPVAPSTKTQRPRRYSVDSVTTFATRDQ